MTSDNLKADPSKLHVIVVGGGIGGLMAMIACKAKGFTVTGLEVAEKFAPIGAGIQIASNCTRVLLEHAGMRELLTEVAAELEVVRFHDLTGKTIADTVSTDGQKEYGAPTWMIHRGDLQMAQLSKAEEMGINIRMNVLVEKFDGAAASVTLKGGEVIKGDVVICADGFKSLARASIKGRVDPPNFSGNSAFRALIPTELLQDPELKEMIDWEKESCFCWVGGNRFIVGYPVRQGKFYNFVSTQPAIHTKDPDTYTALIDSQVVKDEFKDWDPRISKLLAHLPDKTLEWKLCDLEPQDTWLLPGGRGALLGDAAHAVLPSASQGAAMAIEDAGAVAEFLARIESKDQVPAALRAYEALRKPRATEVRDTGRNNVARWKGNDTHEKSTNEHLWGYDVLSAAREFPIEL